MERKKVFCNVHDGAGWVSLWGHRVHPEDAGKCHRATRLLSSGDAPTYPLGASALCSCHGTHYSGINIHALKHNIKHKYSCPQFLKRGFCISVMFTSQCLLHSLDQLWVKTLLLMTLRNNQRFRCDLREYHVTCNKIRSYFGYIVSSKIHKDNRPGTGLMRKLKI